MTRQISLRRWLVFGKLSVLLLAMGLLLFMGLSVMKNGNVGPPIVSAQAVDCNSLFAAFVADRSGVGCNQQLPAAHPPSTCPAQVTPNRCARHIYLNPPDPSLLPPAGKAYQAKWLPRCANATDQCRPEKYNHSVDGTRPLAYIDKAIGSDLTDRVSNMWIFYVSGEGDVCYSTACWTVYTDSTDEESQKSLSTYHPSYQIDVDHQTKDSIGGIGMFNPNGPFGYTDYNYFAHFNRIELDRAGKAESNATEAISLPDGKTAKVYHHGARTWQSLFKFLDTPAGRDLGGGGNDYISGPDLPPLSAATHVLLLGHSGGGVSLIHNADLFSKILKAISPNVEVKMVIDGRFNAMLENEARYNDQEMVSSIFDSIHGNINPSVDLLPLDNLDNTDDGYSDNTYLEVCLGLVQDACALTRNYYDAVGVPLDKSCVETHSGVNIKFCYDYKHVLLNHVKTPFFISMDQLDNVFTGKSAVFGHFQSYEFTGMEHSIRVRDQANDYLNHYDSASEIAPLGPNPTSGADPTSGDVNWNRGVFSSHVGGPGSHVGVRNATNFFRKMERCSPAGVVVETIDRATAIYRWFLYDTEYQASAGYVNASNDNWINAGDNCSTIYP